MARKRFDRYAPHRYASFEFWCSQKNCMRKISCGKRRFYFAVCVRTGAMCSYFFITWRNFGRGYMIYAPLYNFSLRCPDIFTHDANACTSLQVHCDLNSLHRTVFAIEFNDDCPNMFLQTLRCGRGGASMQDIGRTTVTTRARSHIWPHPKALGCFSCTKNAQGKLSQLRRCRLSETLNHAAFFATLMLNFAKLPTQTRVILPERITIARHTAAWSVVLWKTKLISQRVMFLRCWRASPTSRNSTNDHIWPYRSTNYTIKLWSKSTEHFKI